MKYSLIHIDATELTEFRNFINSERLNQRCDDYEKRTNEKRKNDVFVDITDNNYKIQTIIEGININGKKLVRDNESPDFYVLLLPLKVLSDYSFFVEFPKSRFRNYNKEEKYNPKPIIFITSLNIFPNYRIVNRKYRIANTEKREKDFKNRTKYFSIDHRYQFMDSSIWHYYLPIEKWNGKSFNENLQQILTSISENYKLKLYDTVVAREFLEFQTRLMKNSYLESLGGGHASDITPFVFHSEQIMKMKAKEVIDDIAKLFEFNTTHDQPYIEWNVLLIDDYGEKNLKGGHKNKNKIFKDVITDLNNTIIAERNRSKKSLEVEISVVGDEKTKLRSGTEGRSNKDEKLRFIFNMEISVNIKDALNKIENSKKQYDIILLDYLLGQKPDESNNREYGDEFLHKIETSEELNKKRCPLGKFWILPISSFNNAMISKLREEGIGRISDNWYIMDGADMINTPRLFIYNFLKLIHLQLETAIVSKKDIITFIMNNITVDSSDSKNEREENDSNYVYKIRQDARRLYGIFMHKFGLRGALKNDAKQGSAFAKTILDYMYKERYEDLRFYESVRKLLYLVGFSTHHDTALMWDLLTYINSVIVSDFKNSDIKVNSKIDRFLKEVANYISGLKQPNG